MTCIIASAILMAYILYAKGDGSGVLPRVGYRECNGLLKKNIETAVDRDLELASSLQSCDATFGRHGQRSMSWAR